MRRTQVEDRLNEIEAELDRRNSFRNLNADEENTLWIVTLLREKMK